MKLNKKGFTLVELLAVIVILAVIMLVAVTAVGPAITNSKKGAFFSSAASLTDAAALYASSKGLTTTECIKAGTLVSKGYLTKKDNNLYGAVLIVVTNPSATDTDATSTYKYMVSATNNEYSAGITKSGSTYTYAPVEVSSLRNANGDYTLGTVTGVTADPTSVKNGTANVTCS